MADQIITDGTTVFSGGVDSIKVTTVAGELNPQGLRRDQQAWLINATVRDGGISPRWGWQPVCHIASSNVFYQRGAMYDPGNAAPYLMLALNNDIWTLDPTTGAMTNLSTAFPGMTILAGSERAYFCQGEMFMVIQDGTQNPLFWDGALLRRSVGFVGPTFELPPATVMDYYMGRLWYVDIQHGGRTYAAGDIVGGASGTVPYRQRDSILKVTENPLITGGDGFTVPDQSGNIRALKHSANLNSALGQGSLYVFTRKAVYSLNVPVTRTDWINADNNNQPLQTVVQLVNGAVNDDSVVSVNGDLYFQSFEPGIRSLVNAVRYFQQPGNIQISANEQRLIQYNDRSLLRFASGIEFDNRLLQTALPFQTPSGVAHRALVPLDFVPISSFNEPFNPVWEGSYEGLDFMQLFTGDFGGRQRAFAVVNLRKTGDLWLYELTIGEPRDQGDNRVTMQIEFPAFEWGNINKIKKLLGGELWVDRMKGTVEFHLSYRVDGETCPVPWTSWKDCAARDTNEFQAPTLTPYPELCGPGYIQTVDFPAPPTTCSLMRRRSDIGYQFQPVLRVKGYCRIRGLFLHSTEYKKQLYERLPCSQV